MKNLLLIISLLLTATSYSTTLDTLTPPSKISAVTVFFNGAQITRDSNLKLTKGKHLLFFDGLPQEINPQSIQVKGLDGIQILSVKHQLNYKDQGRKSAEEKAVDLRIEKINENKNRIKNQRNVYDIEERILLENSKIAQGNNGVTVEKLEKTADFYRARINSIRKNKQDLLLEIKSLQDELKEAYKKKNELTVKKRQTYSQVLIAVECSKTIQKKLGFSYYISSAGWEPLYDFRVKNISSPLSIIYNANVFQSSGENWKDVAITLSSNNPLLSGNKPEMGNLYLGREQTVIEQKNMNNYAALTGRIFERESGEALPFCNVVIYKGSEVIASSTTDFDGMYTIKPVPEGNYQVKASYVGFKTSTKSNIKLTNKQVRLQDFAMYKGAALQEIAVINYMKPVYFEKDQTTTSSQTTTRQEITQMAVRSVSDIAKTTGGGFYSRDNGSGHSWVRGARSGGSITFIDGVKVKEVKENIYISNSLKRNATHLEYAIDIPYTIPSDGENYNLKIKEVKLTVDYVYYAVPKIDRDAFLTAKLTDWNELNLLSGKTSIYYEGTFTSESFLDVDKADDTLSISLGRDKGVYIGRDGDKALYDKQRFGKNIKEKMGWKITVKNNKNAPITLVVEDQYPLSERRSIEVELLDNTGAKVDVTTGQLSWELKLLPAEKKELKFSYEVEYPKYSNLIVD